MADQIVTLSETFLMRRNPADIFDVAYAKIVTRKNCASGFFTIVRGDADGGCYFPSYSDTLPSIATARAKWAEYRKAAALQGFINRD